MNSLTADPQNDVAAHPVTAERTPGRPTVSVIVANFNGAAYLADAIASAHRQTLRDIEIIVSDDGSTDDSIAIVTRAMAGDPRIRLLQDAYNRGPAAARNRALEVARGEWIAVMDSDDLMHPERLSRLVEAARRDGAVLAADNLLEFFADHSKPSRPLLQGRWRSRPRWVDMADYVRGNLFYVRGPALGYLKPLFHTSILGNCRYDEDLKVGEDYDLVVRLLHAGAKLRVYPESWYFYRKHQTSLSNRADKNVLRAMAAANRRLLHQISPADRRNIAAVQTRMRSIDKALRFEELLDALKTGNWRNAVVIASRSPRVVALLRVPAAKHSRRLLDRIAAAFSRPPNKSSEWRIPGEVDVKR